MAGYMIYITEIVEKKTKIVYNDTENQWKGM